MIRITDSIAISEDDLAWTFVRASGPGGQNVNKVSSAAELRFDVNRAFLPEDLKQRLAVIAGRQLTLDGMPWPSHLTRYMASWHALKRGLNINEASS